MKRIILFDRKKELIDAWIRYFSQYSDVMIHFGTFTDLQVDAIVSPANSFGFMDGGIDQAYTDHFGTHLQKELQKNQSELLVGKARLIPTGNTKIPFLISAPTMWCPHPVDPIAIFLATRAALNYLYKGPSELHDYILPHKIESIAIPGLGTGIGKVAPSIAAHYMEAAYRWHKNPPPFPKKVTDLYDFLNGEGKDEG